MPLKLCTFNCRGLQDLVKRRKVFHYMRNIESDIIFLQETHSDTSDENFWKTQWGESAWFSSFSSNSRGVAILIRNSVSVKVNSVIKDPNGRYLILSALLNDNSMTLVNLYGPNQDDPDFLLGVFGEIDKLNSSSIIVGGDFNTVISPLDYQGSKQHHSNIKSSEMLSVLMDEFGLCDIWRYFHPTLRQYTRHQKNPIVLSRLDFILVSNNFVNNCVKTKILPGVQSDHSVVFLQFNDKYQPVEGHGFWKLNCHYLHHDVEFVNCIKDKIKEFKELHKDTECNPNTLWDTLKCVITGVCLEYTARKKKERNKEKNNLLSEIDKIKAQISNDTSNIDNAPISRLEQLEEKFNKIYDFETKGLIIRSRVRWLEEGERSSKYFCNLENRSWQKKNIYSIRDDEGNIISDQPSILQNIHNFYSRLYSNQNSSQNEVLDNEAFLNLIDSPKLSDDENAILEQHLCKQELFDAIKTMKTNKTRI